MIDFYETLFYSSKVGTNYIRVDWLICEFIYVLPLNYSLHILES